MTKKRTTAGHIAAITILIMVFTCMAPSSCVAFAGTGLFDPVQTEVDSGYEGKNAGKIPVITYHKLVSDKEKKLAANRKNSLFISKSNFDRQMKYLHDNGWRTLSMEEFYLWRKGEIKVPRKSVVITFDDGNYSVIKYAMPTLEKYHMRATVFMIGKYTKKTTKKSSKGKGRYACIGLDVMKQVSSTYPNIEFQSHTWNMHKRGKGGKAYATILSEKAQKEDMQKQYSKFNYTFLAYPYGTYTKKTVSAARSGGIKMAFTYGKNGYATRDQHIYAIKRIKISAGASMGAFRKWIK